MWVGVLGVTQAAIADRAVDLGSRRPRALVAALALHRGRSVATDTIVDLLWGDDPPASYTTTLHAYVSGLRRALEPDRAPRTPSTVLVTTSSGYTLKVDDAEHDGAVFEATVTRVHQALGPLGSFGIGATPMPVEELERLGRELDDALALWRGTPFEDLGDAPDAVAERARLEDLRVVATEDRAALALARGEHAVLTAGLESLTAAHPLRERLWAMRAVALYRSGRQADALDVLGQVRQLLDDELGLEPGAELRDLQAAILRQEDSLTWVPEQRSAPVSRQPEDAPTPSAPPPSTGGRVLSAPPAPPWPTIGRTTQLAALQTVLDQAVAGHCTFAAVVGEPGIGKSRLAYETTRSAYARGVQVAIGRCSQDDGAPPLWPWTAVFESLGAQLPQDETAEDEGSRFRTWHAISQAVLEAARERPLLVVLDDLHWADSSTLRVLRMLVESAENASLAVLGTWRNAPEPTGALADVVDTLARRHALRLDLTGLSGEESAAVVEAVAHDHVGDAEGTQLRERTDGNPFFLVEYARLADGSGTVASLLGETNPPAAVHDVLVRRVRSLPAGSQQRLMTASAIGRQFDLATLASSTDGDVDTTLDDLDPAIHAGLLRVVGPDEFRFAHALVRDSVYAGLGSRRTRVHARIAAAIGEAPQGRESEQARHYLNAGPSYRRQARVAAAAAGMAAREAHAYDEATGLLEQALEIVPLDPTCTPYEHLDLLQSLMDMQRWAGNWEGLVQTVEKGIDVADELGDLPRLGRMAIGATIGALWQSASHGTTHDKVVDALRRALAGLPTEDSELRCRVMLALANEIYYASTNQERDALTEQAIAMARRIDDPALILDACVITFVSTWRASTAEHRLGLVDEAIELAAQVGHDRTGAAALTLRVVALGELGRLDDIPSAEKAARAACERLRLPYGLLVLDTFRLPWLALAGRFDECEEALTKIKALDNQMSLAQYDDASAGAAMAMRLWQGRAVEMLPMLHAMDEAPGLPVSGAVAMYLGRAGRVDEARAYLETHPIDFEADDWFSFFIWGCAADAAFMTGRKDIAASAYERLAPFAGRPLCAGSAMAMGPVDAFLALAAYATGETDLATGHADAALELCQTWDIPLAAAWLQDQRDVHGF